jgi:branched-chain amino acid transport system substrate-binding protein
MTNDLSRRNVLLGGGALLGAGLLASCSSGAERTGGSKAGAASGGKIKLGLLAPLTGVGSGWGPLQAEGFKAAVGVLNAAGGIKELDGLKIELVVLDTETKPDVAAAQAERLAQDENVAMITGCNQSGASIVVAQVAQRNSIPFLTGTDGDPLIVGQGSKFSFRLPPATGEYPIAVLDWILEEEKRVGKSLRRVAFLSSSSKLGQTATEAAVKHAESKGFDIVDVSSYDPTSSDFAPFISRYKSAKVETFMGVHDPQPGVLITKAMRQQDWAPSIFSGMFGTIGTDDWRKAVGNDANYAYNSFPWVFNTKGVGVAQAYVDAFQKANGRAPSSSFDAPGAAVVAVLAEALRVAGGTARADVANAMRKVSLKQGDGSPVPLLAAGGANFDDTGANTDAGLFVAMVKDGELWTVSPKENATAEPVIPRPKWSEI